MDQHLKNQKNNFQKSILNILIFTILMLFNINLYAKEEKFESSEADFYETPTRLIIVVVNGYRGVKCTKNIGCAEVYYYEVNKKTGKSLKLKGKTINIGHLLHFRGYDFKNKDLYYVVYDDIDLNLNISDKESKTIEKEPMSRFLCK